MLLTSWGRYPSIESTILSPGALSEISTLLSAACSLIPRGLGRSYGDSALATQVISTENLNHFIAFEESSGILTCEAGISLAQILSIFVPRGWFLPVTPGTKFVTIGGAIASDVHGKNHHVSGCFSNYVLSFKIIIANGNILECSRESNPDLFYATCGGMGLTGIIVSATIKLIRIESAYINQVTFKAKNLEEILTLFEENKNATYSVAWIDCLASGASLGRSLLMLGEHSQQGCLTNSKDNKLTIPFTMPSFLLNQYSIQAFNALYYHKQQKSILENTVHYDTFFYPLDKLHHWNRLYGKNGFTQYQFVIPKAAGLTGMTEILKEISASKRGSFLSVLKTFGPKNNNYLSFPIEGYTLALDFKIESGLFKLLDRLDKIVLHYDGRIYLTKDVHMSEATFKQSYEQWQTFKNIREKYSANKLFHSLQSQRLGL